MPIIKKDVDAFNLVVAKGGSKLKQPAPAAGPGPDAKSQEVLLDQDGYPKLPAGYSSSRGLATNGIMHLTFRKTTLADLSDALRAVTRARVVDQTGLTGEYDFKLEYSAAEPAVDVLPAVENQLGLKLEKTKISLDMLVIDHLDQRPSDN